MKILFVCHRFPYPPKRGGKIRPFNIISHLTNTGHRVTVGSLVRSEDEEREGQGLRDHCEKIIAGKIGQTSAITHMLARLPTTIPSSMGYFYSRSLHRAIEEELSRSRYDLFFVHCSSAAQYARYASGITSILDFGDMDSQKWFDYSSYRNFPLSIGYWLEAFKLEREEKRLAKRFDVSTCTTQSELRTLQRFGTAKSTDWFPNGVDAEYFSPADEPYDPDLLVFVGRMDYFPNQQAMLYFCDEVLPRLRARRPGTRLKIVGAEPSKEILRLRERPGIEVTGTVPDVRNHVRSAAVSVAPLQIARGTQNKILESMAMGIPVVCSKEAAGGVDVECGTHLEAVSSTDVYVETILRLLENPASRNRLARDGRERILLRHNWKSSMRKLDGIIASAVANST